MNRCLPALVVACLLAPQAPAAPADELRQEWLTEVARMERAIERYGAIADEQSQSFVELEKARLAVDQAIANPEIQVDELRRLERELTRARDGAVRQADAASEARRRIYDALELVNELGARLEGGRRDTEQLVADSGAAGLWEIEWEGETGYGLMRLETKANLALGTYRLSNGNAGSLKGTASGSEIDLEVIHSVRGKIGHVAISLDGGGQSGEGNWMGMELSGGQVAAGAFRIERVE